MEKFPFTPLGFLALQEELYLLTDLELKMESTLIQQDFHIWMCTHFELSQDQLLFLTSIDPRAQLLITIQTAFAIENRLPISLNKDANSLTDQGKIIWPNSSLSAKSGGIAGYEASGALIINIAYQGI